MDKKKRAANARLRKSVARLNKDYDELRQAMIAAQEHIDREETYLAAGLELSAMALAFQLRNISTAVLLIGGTK
jgi:hypothetical protein